MQMHDAAFVIQIAMVASLKGYKGHDQRPKL